MGCNVAKVLNINSTLQPSKSFVNGTMLERLVTCNKYSNIIFAQILMECDTPLKYYT